MGGGERSMDRGPAEDSSDALRIDPAVSQTILAALSRSPLVSVDLDLGRPFIPGARH